MILVTADMGGEVQTFEHATATGWECDDRRHLDILDSGSDVIASYHAHNWIRVWDTKIEPAPEPEPPAHVAEPDKFWQHGSPDL